MVDRLQADPVAGRPFVRATSESRGERAGVFLAVDEGVDVLAVGRDRRQLDAPELVLDPVRIDDAARTTLHRLPVRLTLRRGRSAPCP